MIRPKMRLVPGTRSGDGATEIAKDSPMDLRIGQTLVALGRLMDPQVSLVLRRQALEPRRFGELAIALGFVTQADIDLALARQCSIPLQDVINDLPSALSPASPGDTENIETLLAVRAQLVHRWFGNEPERRALAIVSPNASDGRTWVTVNLGRLFAELDDETLLIDGCLSSPGVHRMLGMDNGVGITNFLRGEVDTPPVRDVPGMPHLHLLSAGPTVPAARTLIAHRRFGMMLEQLATRFQAIFVDTPALSEGGDALTLALLSSGALLVVRRGHSRLADVAGLRDRLLGMTVQVLGAVVNEGSA
jgi:protein-tyrosine kinase